MSIVSEKKFLTEEEKNTLKEIQTNTQALIAVQLEERHANAKKFLTELGEKEKEFTQSVFDKYGKSSINPETGEITPVE